MKRQGHTYRAAAYLRLSVENSGHKDEDTIETQKLRVENYIKKKEDLVLEETYVDNGFSGTSFNRPGFLQMMEDVKNGRIECIVVKDLSRFGRDYIETGYYIERIFPLLDIRFIAIDDDYDSINTEDRESIAIPIKNLVNTLYAREFSKKQEIFKAICLKEGRVMKTNEAYGYSFNHETGRLTIDETTESYVRMIFAWNKIGISCQKIAERLDLIGAPTPADHRSRKNDHKWNDATVRRIIKNPVYAGYHVMGKSKVSLCKNIPSHRIREEDWVYFKDYHEAYVTEKDR